MIIAETKRMVSMIDSPCSAQRRSEIRRKAMPENQKSLNFLVQTSEVELKIIWEQRTKQRCIGKNFNDFKFDDADVSFLSYVYV